MEEVKPIIEESWLEVLKSEFESEYFANLKSFLVEERKHYQCLGSDIGSGSLSWRRAGSWVVLFGTGGHTMSTFVGEYL